jgi:hypothetical protein
MTSEELDAQIVQLEADIAQARAAITVILTGAQSYSTDTGQSRVQVERARLGELRLYKAGLEEQLNALRLRRGGGVIRVIPDF